MSMNVGSVVLATSQGLGYLAKDFYDHGIINKVYVHPHSTRENHYDWYPDRVENAEDLLDCDVILFFETAFDWTLILKAREKGVKTVLMPMYECSPMPMPYFVDEVWCPSALDFEVYKEHYKEHEICQPEHETSYE